MFFRRGVSDDDPWLRIKLWLFSVGAILALLGMGFRNDWLMGAAGVVLAGGIVLRFFRDRRGRSETDGAPDQGPD